MPPRAEHDPWLSQLILVSIKVLVSIRIANIVERRHRAAVAASYVAGWQECEREAAAAAALDVEKVARAGLLKLRLHVHPATPEPAPEPTALDDAMAERAGYVPDHICDHICCKTT